MTATPSALPDVVFVDCHDLGDWLGTYNRPYLSTPRLDELGASGAVCDQYFSTAPICMPSRAAIFTGVMPHMAGVTGQDPLNGAYRCLPQYLQGAGYETVCSGGLMVTNPPAEIGFERVLPAKGDSERAAAAAEFLIERGRETGRRRPLYLHVSFTHVHRPFGLEYYPAHLETIPVPPGLPDLPDTRRDLATLARNVAELDALVGQVIDAVDRAGLRERTLFVFTTEHGVAIPRAKHTLFDGGIKTSLLMRCPGVIPEGSRPTQLLSNVDLLPTLLDLFGLPTPTGILGRSFAALLGAQRPAGEAHPGRAHGGRDAVFAEQTWGRRSGRYYYTPMRCVRTSRWKYIRNFTDQPPYVDNGFVCRYVNDRETVERYFSAPSPTEQLFDLAADPGEMRNLAGEPEHAIVLENLRSQLDRFLTDTEDPVLAGPVPSGAGAPDAVDDPQWVRPGETDAAKGVGGGAEGGRYHLSPEDPAGDREQPFEAIAGTR